jgi:pimeloyl-ACP methyl ester carboxylesterase
VRTLTLGCTTPGGPGSIPTDRAVVAALAAAAMSGDREQAMEVAWTYNVSATFAANAEAKAAIGATLTEAPASLPVLLAQLQAIAGHDTLDRLHEISAPTLVVHGTDDQMLPVGNAALIAERIAGSRLEILDDVGHVFWWERPELTAELVRDAAGAPAPS